MGSEMCIRDRMLNIGYRPTVSGEFLSIEVNIFDFDQDIYGEQLQLSFVDFLREEVKFNGVEDLKKQLAKDKIRAKEILSP